MKLAKLFTMQKELDSYIESNQGIQTDVFKEKGLALLVELAELANETRCFKFWSTKGPSERQVILEEYVDSVHFLLSLGIAKGLNDLEEWPVGNQSGNLTELFIAAQEEILKFLRNPDLDHYRKVWEIYSAIAAGLGFENEEIIHAYIQKNEKNYERQRTGY
ncbi:dUTP diphosphatase [Chungangia koreensis]|uniref:dUTP diphosphatase n=1 Tax=Chungangia koreensis TaxID=752657 RepID=A0ABV8X357_9LACT